MSAFSAEWLALREPADVQARISASALLAPLVARQSGRSGLLAVDLAAGSGANVRHLLPQLPAVAHWTLVDHDAGLLAEAWRRLMPVAGAAGRSFDVRAGDLRALDTLPLDGAALVTASALLDLVSQSWLHAFAARCGEVRADVLCALSYDGRITCSPADNDDAGVRALVNQHQRTDKGFGPALGPDAAGAAAATFEAVGFVVQAAPSDWVLDGAHSELQRQLLSGWASAARDIAPADAALINAWCARRLAHVEAGVSRLVVGHVDLVATLA